MTSFDIAFVGHMCFDEIVPYRGEPYVSPGSAVLCGAVAAARIGRRVAVVTRMSPDDEGILQPMKELGIKVFVAPAEATTYSVVIHPSQNVDERILRLKRSAGFFLPEDMPDIDAAAVHLAGISDREFSLDFMRALKARGYALSADMQSFVRQVDPSTRDIAFNDVPRKREIAGLLDMVKLDIVEAKALTGTDDLEAAALRIESWGCPEIVITRADGVLARAGGQTYYEKFSNRSAIGRTGRGDTTFAAYLARRRDHDAPSALAFAAALVSIKMETPGPFQGSLADVLQRMKERG